MVEGRSGNVGTVELEVAGVCVRVEDAAEGAEERSHGLGGEGVIS